MAPGQIPEFVMSLLHSSMVHQVAVSTFQQPQQQNSNNNNNNNNNKSDSTTTTTAAINNSNNTTNNADRSAEFYHRLEALGFSIGLRAAERLLAATPIASNNTSERPQDDAVNLLRTVLWPSLFGKELGRENDPAGAAAATVTSSANNSTKNNADTNNLVYKLIDVDFSWVRSVAFPPESASLADPFVRGMHYDLLEDPSSFAAGISASQTATSGHHHHHHQQQNRSNKETGGNTSENQKQKKDSSASTLPSSSTSSSLSVSTGPNDYVVLLTGMMLGFFSSLGFGSHAERRIFGGDRAVISSSLSSGTANNNVSSSSVSSSTVITPKTGGGAALGPDGAKDLNNTISAASSAIISRPPLSFVTVRHRLLSRDGEAFRPSGMQLKLVVHFS